MAINKFRQKRDFQFEDLTEEENLSFTVEGCGLKEMVPKKRRRTIHGKEINQCQKENSSSDNIKNLPRTGPSTNVFSKIDFPSSVTSIRGTVKSTLKRRVSTYVLQHKLRTLQDYSLPSVTHSDNHFLAQKRENNEDTITSALPERKTNSLEQNLPVDTSYKPSKKVLGCSEALAKYRQDLCLIKINFQKWSPHLDTDLQQKIDHEIKMREGTTKLLAASKHPSQRLEAARSLLCSNTRIIAYMTELQRRKTQEVLGQTQSTEGNQLPCRAQVCISDIRIPLMWKDTDHFKNKGDFRQYAVFCLLKVGTEIYDTSMITDVDRRVTDITFDDVLLFQEVPHDFELKFEVYCHKLHEEFSAANTPKKIRKKITDISGSVGRSVGKRLSGLNDADVIGSMILGPRFELVAKGTLSLQDVDDSVRTYDLELEKNSEGSVHELPLFGHYCCRVAAVPSCLVRPVVSGFLNVQEDDDLSKWRRYWCMLKNLQLACWSSPSDIEVAQPLLTIQVTKSTQISDADPSTCKRAHTFLIRTVSERCVSEHTLAADTKEDLNKWWDGFQQHLLDQALWKHACDEIMEIKSSSKNKKPFLRKSSIYDDTPLIEPDSVSESLASDLKVDDDQLTKMLTTLMGEASQIRGSPTRGSPL